MNTRKQRVHRAPAETPRPALPLVTSGGEAWEMRHEVGRQSQRGPGRAQKY